MNINLFVFLINCGIYGLEITYFFSEKILPNICIFKTFAHAEFAMHCSTRNFILAPLDLPEHTQRDLRLFRK